MQPNRELTSNMDGTGDMKEETIPGVAKDTTTTVSESNTDYNNKALVDPLSVLKRTADVEQQVADSKQRDADFSVKAAAVAQFLAEMAHETDDDKEKHRRELEDDIRYDKLCDKIFQNSISGTKRTVDFTQQVADSKQRDAEFSINAASDTNILAEMAHKTADDREKSRRELEGYALCDMMLQASITGANITADFTQQVADSKQRDADRAIRAASNAKIVADRSRRAADNSENSRRELGEGSALCDKMLRATSRSLKCTADVAQQMANSKQRDADCAIRAASDAKILAEMARRHADDRENCRRELRQGDALCYKMIQHSISAIKCTADFTQHVADSKQRAADCAIKAAFDAQVLAEMTRRDVDDGENCRRELEGGALRCRMFQDSISAMKRTADFTLLVSDSKQRAADCAVRAAFDAKSLAEMTRRDANDRENCRRELEGSALCYKMIIDSISALKRAADFTQEVADDKQSDADRAIRTAADAKILAEMARRDADDRENYRRELGVVDALYYTMLQDSISAAKRAANFTQEVADDKQRDADRAIKAAADAKIVAQMTRKTADDSENSRRGLGEGDAVYYKMIEDSIGAIKRTADFTQQVTASLQRAADLAIKTASDAETFPEMAYKTANDRENSRRGLGGGDASTASGMTRKTGYDREKESRLKLGGDVL